MSDHTVLSFLVEVTGTSGLRVLGAYNQELQGTNTRLRELAATSAHATTTDAKYAESVKATTAAQTGANAATAKTAETTKAAATEYQRAGAAATEMGGAAKRGGEAAAAGAAAADGSTQRLARTHAQAASEATKHSNALTSLGTSLTNAGRKTSDFGHAMSGISLPLGVAGAASLKLAIDFQKDMTLISTQANAGEAEVKKMTKAILDLAPKVGQTPDQLAKALFPIESVGIRGRDALNALKLAAEGAAIGETSVVDVSNTLVSVLKSQIGGVKDASDAMSQMNAIIGEGKMHMQDLTGALSTGILSTAKGVSLTFRDIGAALDFFTAQGTPAEAAATRLKQTLSLMENPSTKAIGALQGIGLNAQSLANDMQKPNGLLVAVQDLKKHLDDTFPPSGGHKLSIDDQRKALDQYKQTLEGAGVSGKKLQDNLDAFKLKLKQSGSTAVEQAQVILSAFGGGRMGATMLAMVENADQLKQKYQDLADGAGAKKFAAAWEQTQKDTAHQLKVMEAVAATTGIKFGKDMLPALNDVLKTAEGLLKAFSGLPAPVRHGIEVLGLLGVALGPIATAFGSVTKGVGALARLGGMVLPGRAGEKATGFANVLGGGGLIYGARNTSVMPGSLVNPIAVVVEGGFGERGSPFGGGGLPRGGGGGGTPGDTVGKVGAGALAARLLGTLGVAAAVAEFDRELVNAVKGSSFYKAPGGKGGFWDSLIPSGSLSDFLLGKPDTTKLTPFITQISGALKNISPPPFISTVANAVKGLTGQTKDLGQASQQTHGKTTQLSTAFAQQKNAVDVARGAGHAFGQNLLAVADGLQTTRGRTNIASQGLTSLGGVFGHLGSQLDSSKQKTDAANKSLGQTKPTTDTASQGLKSLGSIFDKFSSQLDNQRTKNDSTNKSLQQTKPSADTASQGIRSLGSIVDHYAGQAQNAKSKTDDASSAMRAAKPAADTASQGVSNLGTTFDNTAHTAGSAMANIQSNVDNALKALGAKPVSFSLTAVGQAASGHAAGGYIGQPGERGHDQVHALLGRGEAVLNGDHQGPVQMGLAASKALGMQPYGSLGELFSNVTTDHASTPRFGVGGYVNPVPGLAPERIDQGKDFGGAGNVLAIGPGVVTESGLWPGWPGSGGIVYRLTSGPKSGMGVYTMESFRQVLGTGAHVNAGQVIGQATGGGTGIEMGWANSSSSGPLTPYNGSADGTPMPGGKDFAAFLASLGVGGAAGAAVGGLGGIVIPTLKSPHINGPAGAWRTLAQSAADTVTKAANDFLQKQAPSGTGSAVGGVSGIKGPWNFSNIGQLWQKHGGPAIASNLAAHVAYAESGFDPNSNSGQAEGLWQINPSAWPNSGNLFDPDNNATQAVKIYKGEGNSFLPAWQPSQFGGAGGGWQKFARSGASYGRGGMVAPFVGSYRDGGTVPADGLAYVHQGETITSARAPHHSAQTTRPYNVNGHVVQMTPQQHAQALAKQHAAAAKHDRDINVGGVDLGVVDIPGHGKIRLPHDASSLKDSDWSKLIAQIVKALAGTTQQHDVNVINAIGRGLQNKHLPKAVRQHLQDLYDKASGAIIKAIDNDFKGLEQTYQALLKRVGLKDKLAGFAQGTLKYVQDQLGALDKQLAAEKVDRGAIARLLKNSQRHHDKVLSQKLRAELLTIDDVILQTRSDVQDARAQAIQARITAITDRFEPTVALQDTALQILEAQQKLAGTDNATLSALKGNQGGVLTPAQIAAARATTAAQNQDIQAEIGTKQQEMSADQALLPTLRGTDASTMQQTIASLELSILTLQGTVHDNNQSLQDLTKATDQNTTATQNLTTSGTLTVSYQNDVFAIGGRQSSDEAAILGTGV